MGDFFDQVVFVPGDEAAPDVLGLLPENLDQVEFGAVGRQMAQDEMVIGTPTFEPVGIDAAMDGGIVEDHEGGATRRLRGQAVEKGRDIGTLDRMAHGFELQGVGGIVEDRQRIGPAGMADRLGGMGVAAPTPGPLYVGRGGKAALVQVEQPAMPGPGSLLQIVQADAGRLEFFSRTLFLRAVRVRRYTRPRRLSQNRSRSPLTGGPSGCA